jgi:hypothetical protein
LLSKKNKHSFASEFIIIYKNIKRMTYSEDSPSKFLLLYGLAKKSYFDMTDTERQVAAQSASERAKEAAFSRGLPIIYGASGLVIAEYANGKRFVHENGKDIRPYV